MRVFKSYKTNYISKIPKITYMYAGYKGFNNGLCLLWNKRCIPLILPVNERA